MGMRGGKLRITARVEGARVYIDVADNGPGIPEGVRDRLFEPFVTQRASPDHDDGTERKGTGLGLCICRDLVRAAGGTIGVDSTPGQGATFHLSLPKADEVFEST
jgi:signal transduction histidine kinase